MVEDRQVRRLMKLIQTEDTLATAAAKAGMDEKTARKYRDLGKLPSEVRSRHTWRTREDPFDEVWEEVRDLMETGPSLQAKTIFEWLQRREPGRYQDGQLRTLQRRLKIWRATEGPAKEVYFAQHHEPGKLGESDFAHMTALEVTIAGQSFPHMIYHFVLPYSNWETGTICFSESFESLSGGLQNALWELGGVPGEHQTDRLSAAVHNLGQLEEFTRRYNGLLAHYGMQGRKINTGEAHENGDVEQRHYRFRMMVDQALMMRGSRDFMSRAEYEGFLRQLFARANAGRRDRFQEELKVLRALPLQRLDTAQRLRVRVGQGSTVAIHKNVYSVHSRLIGEQVEAVVRTEAIEIWYARRRIETLPRLRGSGRYRIDYRHVIDWLVRKPNAFENYCYREDLFPTTRFRIAYDDLRRRSPRPSREYLAILEIAAKESESGVDEALRVLIEREEPVSVDAVKRIMESGEQLPAVTDVEIEHIELSVYDELLVGVAE
jgi:hypothetical protein